MYLTSLLSPSDQRRVSGTLYLVTYLACMHKVSTYQSYFHIHVKPRISDTFGKLVEYSIVRMGVRTRLID